MNRRALDVEAGRGHLLFRGRSIRSVGPLVADEIAAARTRLSANERLEP